MLENPLETKKLLVWNINLKEYNLLINWYPAWECEKINPLLFNERLHHTKQRPDITWTATKQGLLSIQLKWKELVLVSLFSLASHLMQFLVDPWDLDCIWLEIIPNSFLVVEMVINRLHLLFEKSESSFVVEYSLIGTLERVLNLISFEYQKSANMTEMSSFKHYPLPLYLQMR